MVSIYVFTFGETKSGSDKECKYFPVGMRRKYGPGHSCGLCFQRSWRLMVVMYLGTRTFNFYLLDSFTFEGLIIFVITSSPQRLVRLHLVGNTFPLSHLVGFWVFVSGGCAVLKAWVVIICSVLVSCILVELCNVTRAELNSQALSSSCTPTPVYESWI